MKSWQIFAVGIVVMVAALSLRIYEPILAGVAAVFLVTAVVAGFLLPPRREVFYLRTTVVLSEPDYLASVDHDQIAVRLEVVRLWLLFLPTFMAVAFFIVTATKGNTWKYSIMDHFWDDNYFFVLTGIRLFVAGVIGLLSAWLSERWVFRDAHACSADSVSAMGGRILYSFIDPAGGYYGGETFPFGLVRQPKLARLVFYNVNNPDLSKIAMGCLFHRPVIIGRGLTDLDRATSDVKSAEFAPDTL